MPDGLILDVDQIGVNDTVTSTSEHFRVNADLPYVRVPRSVVACR
jgi:hypothetical protein